jgi:pimeloyl-ACP methyl ester carboxylesterase
MRRGGFGSAVVLVVLAASLAPASSAAARAKLPVPYDFGAAIAAQSRAPDSAPPGANDWRCKPTRARPNPVVLVHGLAANQTVNWQTMSPLLANNGYCVFSLTYGTRDEVEFPGYQPGGLNRMEQSARQLRDFVKRILQATGARKVDIVGHSEGSLMPNYFVKFLGGSALVRRYVGLTPLWGGTDLAAAGTLDQLGQSLGLSDQFWATIDPYCSSCRQFVRGSEFLRKMNTGGPAVPGVVYTMIMTRYDELVIPYTSGVMPGATNIVIQDQCPQDFSEHLALAFDPNAGRDILNALDPRHARAPRCVAVLPGYGAPGGL